MSNIASPLSYLTDGVGCNYIIWLVVIRLETAKNGSVVSEDHDFPTIEILIEMS